MVKAFAVGFLGAAAALMVAFAVWFAVQSLDRPALVWGGVAYQSKQEFNLYLESKGLSYATWLRRNPGVAPWEPGRRAAESDRSGEGRDWTRDMLLAANAALLATLVALVFASSGDRGQPRKESLTGPPEKLSSAVLRRTVAQGFGYVELGAEELTHAAIDRIRERPEVRQELKVIAVAAALAATLGVLVTLLLN